MKNNRLGMLLIVLSIILLVVFFYFRAQIEKDIDNAVNIIKENHSNFDAIINCAAIVAMEKINEITYSKFEKAFKVNTVAPLYFLSSLFDNIVKNEADILNIGTTADLKSGFNDQLAYTSTKYGLRGGSYNIGLELAKTKNAIAILNKLPLAGKKTLVVVASSIPQDKDGRTLVVDALNLDVADGRFLEIDDSNKILVGNGFYENEKFPKKVFTGDKIDINGYDFEVVGILEKSGNPQFNDLFLLNEKDLEKVLDIEDEMDLVVVQVTNVNDIEKVSNDINRELRKTRDVEEGKEDFSISTPQETLESVNTILNVVQIVIIGIAGISLVVGGIGIMNTMYTAVLERRREIGIMKSVGARNSDILIIFIIESGILGFVGGVIGVILGVGFSKFVEIAATLALGPGILAADISLGLIIGSLSFSFFVGTISGILPAKQASDLQPVDALRQ